jgi:hypothetical protein
MVTNPTTRANFVNTSVTFLRKYNFDGLDLDWEYPGSRTGARSTDKFLFTSLLIELKSAYKPYGLLLTAAVGVGIIFYFILNFNKIQIYRYIFLKKILFIGFSTADNAYEISKITKYILHYIFIIIF